MPSRAANERAGDTNVLPAPRPAAISVVDKLELASRVDPGNVAPALLPAADSAAAAVATAALSATDRELLIACSTRCNRLFIPLDATAADRRRSARSADSTAARVASSSGAAGAAPVEAIASRTVALAGLPACSASTARCCRTASGDDPEALRVCASVRRSIASLVISSGYASLVDKWLGRAFPRRVGDAESFRAAVYAASLSADGGGGALPPRHGGCGLLAAPCASISVDKAAPAAAAVSAASSGAWDVPAASCGSNRACGGSDLCIRWDRASCGSEASMTSLRGSVVNAAVTAGTGSKRLRACARANSNRASAAEADAAVATAVA